MLTDGLILSNGIAMVIRILEFGDDLEESAQEFSASWDTILFVGCKYHGTKPFLFYQFGKHLIPKKFKISNSYKCNIILSTE